MFGPFPFRFACATLSYLAFTSEQNQLSTYLENHPDFSFYDVNDFFTVYGDEKEFSAYLNMTSNVVRSVFDEVRSYRRFAKRASQTNQHFNCDTYYKDQYRFRFGICFGNIMEVFIQVVLNSFIKISGLSISHTQSYWMANLYLDIDGFWGYTPYDITKSSDLSSRKEDMLTRGKIAILIPNTRHTSNTMQLLRKVLLYKNFICEENHKILGIAQLHDFILPIHKEMVTRVI